MNGYSHTDPFCKLEAHSSSPPLFRMLSDLFSRNSTVRKELCLMDMSLDIKKFVLALAITAG